ncbi:MAG TPA: magnesium transporter, partial [Spirochaetia bacterium]|nr:magnesium transporter [Spirochaetia bacterium]
MRRTQQDFDSLPVDSYMHDNFVALDESNTVEQSLTRIREITDDGRVIYYYTKDSHGRLTGVVPARTLLTSAPGELLSAVSKKDIVRVTTGSTMRDVAEVFASHRYLSLPVVDDADRVIGVVDLKPFTNKDIDVSDKALLDDIFQTIGIRVSKILTAGPLRTFTFRFPWLLSTLASGVVCAVLVGAFEQTLSRNIILAFFITLVLALGESLSIQSMSIALQRLHQHDATRSGKFLVLLAKEATVGFLLGASCGTVAFAISAAWKGQLRGPLAIGTSITLSIVVAACLGLSVPILLHALRKDPRIASGPLVLAATDICTILIYMSVSRLILS